MSQYGTRNIFAIRSALSGSSETGIMPFRLMPRAYPLGRLAPSDGLRYHPAHVRGLRVFSHVEPSS